MCVWYTRQLDASCYGGKHTCPVGSMPGTRVNTQKKTVQCKAAGVRRGVGGLVGRIVLVWLGKVEKLTSAVPI